MPRWEPQAQGIPQGTLAVNNVPAKNTTNSKKLRRKFVEISGMAARRARQGHAIYQNIIGRSATGGIGRFGLEIIRGGQHGLFALLDQPARQHGRSVFLKVLIEQS
jgi:hypothetical protein